MTKALPETLPEFLRNVATQVDGQDPTQKASGRLRKAADRLDGLPDDDDRTTNELQPLAAQVYRVRCAQRAYFQDRTSENLAASKAEERKLDAMIARVRTGGPVTPDRQSNLFDTPLDQTADDLIEHCRSFPARAGRELFDLRQLEGPAVPDDKLEAGIEAAIRHCATHPVSAARELRRLRVWRANQ